MKTTHLIPTLTICTHYNIEVSFVDTLHNMGLIQMEEIEQETFIHKEQITDLEKILRLHHDLQVNLEGVDVVLNLLGKEKTLREEIKVLRNRLSVYEEGEF